MQSSDVIINTMSESGTQQQHPTIVGVLNKTGTNLKRTIPSNVTLAPSPKVIIRPNSSTQHPIIVSTSNQSRFVLSPTKIITAIPTKSNMSPGKVTVMRNPNQISNLIKTPTSNVVTVKTINGNEQMESKFDSPNKQLTIIGQQNSGNVSKVQFVRVVTTNQSGSSLQSSLGTSIVRSIAPATQNIQFLSKPGQHHRRILLPASTPMTIKPGISYGTSILKPIGTTLSSKGQSPHILTGSGLANSAINDPMKNIFRKTENGPGLGNVYLETTGQRPRKPCNCTKSQCLKLYCDCFANGEFCQNCNCACCANNLSHEEERSRAIKACLDRNPLAFHPKIGKGRHGGGNRRHNKGCNCKRSNCLKNYCECYEAKVPCSMSCRCVCCKNSEEAANSRLIRSASKESVGSDDINPLPSFSNWSSMAEKTVTTPVVAVNPGTKREVIVGEMLSNHCVSESIMNCMLQQAEDSCQSDTIHLDLELAIIQEFARCLMQVATASRKTAPNPAIAW